MKLSWTSLKISIAGAKLNHLVQKDRIWDHGSMTEQARILFYLVQKAKRNANTETLKKYMTPACFKNLYEKMVLKETIGETENRVITELVVLEVHPGKKNKPDMFTTLIKGYSKNLGSGYNKKENRFSEQWSFLRQGDWWVLDDMKNSGMF